MPSPSKLILPALTIWAVTLTVILTRTGWWGLGALILAGIICSLVWPAGLITVIAGLGALAVSWVRVWRADHAAWADTLRAHVEAVSSTTNGGWLVTAGPLPILVHGTPPPVGAVIDVTVSITESNRPSVSGVFAVAREWSLVADPHGWARITADIHARYLDAVSWLGHTGARGLIPGMVLGDTSLQSPESIQLYAQVGLSHLSAVSGSNVAIVTTACALLVWWAGPKLRIGVGVGALLVYVGIVGLEPSVLRAAVTGMVGFIAVASARRTDPIHALSVAVIGLILWDSDLAVSYGFALSVVATAGIVIVSPVFAAPLLRTGLPPVVVRAIAVAIAADLTTMPIVAMMTSRVSTVSVVANVLADPAVAPVTILGLIAVPLCYLPGGLERIPLFVAEPCARWVDTVAHTVSAFPLAQLPVPAGFLGVGWVCVIVGWLIWAMGWWGLRYNVPRVSSSHSRRG